MEYTTRIALGGLTLIAAFSYLFLATAGPVTPDTVTFSDSFEDGFGEWAGQGQWQTAADVPTDANTGQPVEWNITTTQRAAHNGNKSVAFLIDGLQDDGTIWLQRDLQLEPGTRYNISLSVSALAPVNSFNIVSHVVLYTGTTPPSGETSFPEADTVDRSGSSGGLRRPLAVYMEQGTNDSITPGNDSDNSIGGSPSLPDRRWTAYNVTWRTPELDDSTVTVAFGISLVWETRIGVMMDDLTVTATPITSR
ncbi:MAG: hypothetical protein SV186_00380 [Candidatus Nanohaloarchaea archaeon]|nr:hypothetical protein [Candidatus Nanohaloarchaea archaeon]